MPRIIDADHAEPAIRAMVGAADVDAGPTEEQLNVIGALASGYYAVDVDFATIEPLGPWETADAFPDPALRRRVRELLVLVEMCRHPISATQAARVEEYCVAMGQSGPDVMLVRDLIEKSRVEAAADYMRFFTGATVGPMLEQQLAAHYAAPLAAPAPELAERLSRLGDAGPDTLGAAYLDFYARNGFELPGIGMNMPAVFVSHDMCHVIAGYEPIAVDEIALGAMQLGMTDSDAHWLQFLGNLGVHEAGFLDGGGSLVPKEGGLSRPGAPGTIAHAMWRGAQCTTDFTTVDHLALADLPLADIRASFGIPERVS